jgi:uncharacterized protein
MHDAAPCPSRAQPPIDSVSELCVRCGVCCTGLLYQNGTLEPDQVALAAELGMETFTTPDGALRFRLGCPRLAGTVCSVYDRERPRICGQFFCALAKGMAKGEIPEPEAHARVTSVRELIDTLKAAMEPGETFAAAIQRAPQSPRLGLALVAVQLFLDRHFRSDGDNFWIEPKASPSREATA